MKLCYQTLFDYKHNDFIRHVSTENVKEQIGKNFECIIGDMLKNQHNNVLQTRILDKVLIL